MESVLNYQEVYLGQVQLLNVVPIKELAATFSNLKVCPPPPPPNGLMFVLDASCPLYNEC